MTTANAEYFDAAIRHQIGIRNFTSGEVRRVLALLERADRSLVTTLRRRLATLPANVSFTDARFLELLREVRTLRNVAMTSLRGQLTPTLHELARMEVDFEQRMLDRSIPIEVSFASVSALQLRAIVTSTPFGGKLLNQWYQSLAAADQVALRDALQEGLALGESVPQLVRRVAGTKARGFTDGVLALTRRKAEAVVRTAANHVSNSAREALWRENSSLIQVVRWTATLDGRTSSICRARDGEVATLDGSPVPEGMEPLVPPTLRPPAHVGCRSTMVAVIDGVGILGTRPTVTDTRNRRRREIDFRAEAKRRGVPIQQVRKEWADRNIGQMPAETTYQEFLSRQPAEFQDDVLGKTKGKLFRAGAGVDEFVDQRGNELTLAQLADTQPEAFIRAGLDPEDF